MWLPPTMPAHSQLVSVLCGAASSSASSVGRGLAGARKCNNARYSFTSEPFLGEGSCAALHAWYCMWRPAARRRSRSLYWSGPGYYERGCALSPSVSLSLVCMSRSSTHPTVSWILSPASAHVVYVERRLGPSDECVTWSEILCIESIIKVRERALWRSWCCSWSSSTCTSSLWLTPTLHCLDI